MKGLSVLLTFALFVFAHQLSLSLKRLGALEQFSKARSSTVTSLVEARLEADIQSRALGRRRFPTFRMEGRLRNWSLEEIGRSANTVLAF